MAGAAAVGEPSLLGELALWRSRAGLLAKAPAQADELFRLQIAGGGRRVAQVRAEQGCRYEAALALADVNDDQTLRQAYDELRALGATPAAAIVARLVISERTVDHHVSAILRKPSVRTRGEAIAAVVRLGVLCSR